MSGLVNKVKEALHSDKHTETGTTHPTDSHATHHTHTDNTHHAPGASGPHHTAGHAGGAGAFTGVGDAQTGTYTTGTGAVPGSHGGVTGVNDPQGTHGPHSSRVANSVDPRVDSDHDRRGHPGSGAGYGTSAHTNTGATGGAGVTGYNDPTGTHGTHNSRLANAADPRFDSDRDHRGAPGAAGTAHYGSGPGPAPNTAGPHKSDMLNKADPRIDSDLDGSKTYGGNKTLSETGGHRDPRDASQVPPSVLRQHVGDPSIQHEDLSHSRSERHQSLSHQEAHRGV